MSLPPPNQPASKSLHSSTILDGNPSRPSHSRHSSGSSTGINQDARNNTVLPRLSSILGPEPLGESSAGLDRSGSRSRSSASGSRHQSPDIQYIGSRNIPSSNPVHEDASGTPLASYSSKSFSGLGKPPVFATKPGMFADGPLSANGRTASFDKPSFDPSRFPPRPVLQQRSSSRESNHSSSSSQLNYSYTPSSASLAEVGLDKDRFVRRVLASQPQGQTSPPPYPHTTFSTQPLPPSDPHHLVRRHTNDVSISPRSAPPTSPLPFPGHSFHSHSHGHSQGHVSTSHSHYSYPQHHDPRDAHLRRPSSSSSSASANRHHRPHRPSLSIPPPGQLSPPLLAPDLPRDARSQRPSSSSSSASRPGPIASPSTPVPFSTSAAGPNLDGRGGSGDGEGPTSTSLHQNQNHHQKMKPTSTASILALSNSSSHTHSHSNATDDHHDHAHLFPASSNTSERLTGTTTTNMATTMSTAFVTRDQEHATTATLPLDKDNDTNLNDISTSTGTSTSTQTTVGVAVGDPYPKPNSMIISPTSRSPSPLSASASASVIMAPPPPKQKLSVQIPPFSSSASASPATGNSNSAGLGPGSGSGGVRSATSAGVGAGLGLVGPGSAGSSASASAIGATGFGNGVIGSGRERDIPRSPVSDDSPIEVPPPTGYQRQPQPQAQLREQERVDLSRGEGQPNIQGERPREHQDHVQHVNANAVQHHLPQHQHASTSSSFSSSQHAPGVGPGHPHPHPQSHPRLQYVTLPPHLQQYTQGHHPQSQTQSQSQSQSQIPSQSQGHVLIDRRHSTSHSAGLTGPAHRSSLDTGSSQPQPQLQSRASISIPTTQQQQHPPPSMPTPTSGQLYQMQPQTHTQAQAQAQRPRSRTNSLATTVVGMGNAYPTIVSQMVAKESQSQNQTQQQHSSASLSVSRSPRVLPHGMVHGHPHPQSQSQSQSQSQPSSSSSSSYPPQVQRYPQQHQNAYPSVHSTTSSSPSPAVIHNTHSHPHLHQVQGHPHIHAPVHSHSHPHAQQQQAIAFTSPRSATTTVPHSAPVGGHPHGVIVIGGGPGGNSVPMPGVPMPSVHRPGTTSPALMRAVTTPGRSSSASSTPKMVPTSVHGASAPGAVSGTTTAVYPVLRGDATARISLDPGTAHHPHPYHHPSTSPATHPSQPPPRPPSSSSSSFSHPAVVQLPSQPHLSIMPMQTTSNRFGISLANQISSTVLGHAQRALETAWRTTVANIEKDIMDPNGMGGMESERERLWKEQYEKEWRERYGKDMEWEWRKRWERERGTNGAGGEGEGSWAEKYERLLREKEDLERRVLSDQHQLRASTTQLTKELRDREKELAKVLERNHQLQREVEVEKQVKEMLGNQLGMNNGGVVQMTAQSVQALHANIEHLTGQLKSMKEAYDDAEERVEKQRLRKEIMMDECKREKKLRERVEEGKRKAEEELRAVDNEVRALREEVARLREGRHGMTISDVVATVTPEGPWSIPRSADNQTTSEIIISDSPVPMSAAIPTTASPATSIPTPPPTSHSDVQRPMLSSRPSGNRPSSPRAQAQLSSSSTSTAVEHQLEFTEHRPLKRQRAASPSNNQSRPVPPTTSPPPLPRPSPPPPASQVNGAQGKPEEGEFDSEATSRKRNRAEFEGREGREDEEEEGEIVSPGPRTRPRLEEPSDERDRIIARRRSRSPRTEVLSDAQTGRLSNVNGHPPPNGSIPDVLPVPPPPQAQMISITPYWPYSNHNSNPVDTSGVKPYYRDRPTPGGTAVRSSYAPFMTPSAAAQYREREKERADTTMTSNGMTETSSGGDSTPNGNTTQAAPAPATAPPPAQQEPKLTFRHTELLYDTVGGEYVCRECRSQSKVTMKKPQTFPTNSPSFADMFKHSWDEHKERCEEVVKYNAVRIASELVQLKQGAVSGVIMGSGSGSGSSGGGSTGGSGGGKNRKKQTR